MNPKPCPHCGTTLRQNREDRLCVGCGKPLPKELGVLPKDATARELIRRFMEMRGLTPDFAEWSEERLAGNPPRRIRLRRLRVLFDAFGIEWDPIAFTKGKFIDPENPRYAPVVERLVALMPAIREHGPPGYLRYQLPECFAFLLGYRESLERALAFPHCVFEASGLFYFAYMKAEELNRIIWEHVGIVEDILVTLICPEAPPEMATPPPYEYYQSGIDDGWW